MSGSIPHELSKLHDLSILDVSSNILCRKIPRGTQISTFNVTSFQKNKCLWGCPLDSCNENGRPIRQGDSASKSNDVKVDLLNHLDKNMSLIALGIGVGIGFGGVVILFMSWES